jgi:hypothetical protein
VSKVHVVLLFSQVHYLVAQLGARLTLGGNGSVNQTEPHIHVLG